MSLRGRAPKPSKLEAAQGFPGKRKPNPREPKPRELEAADLKRAPRGMDERERKWWHYYSLILGGMRVLTEADRTALATLATSSAERENNDEQLRKTGPIYKTPDGYIRVSPLFKCGSVMRARELKLLQEFGLTPSARTRVSMVAEAGGAEMDLAALLSAPRTKRAEKRAESVQ
jgi:P27 family predicted phage terminase small subunit